MFALIDTLPATYLPTYNTGCFFMLFKALVVYCCLYNVMLLHHYGGKRATAQLKYGYFHSIGPACRRFSLAMLIYKKLDLLNL